MTAGIRILSVDRRCKCAYDAGQKIALLTIELSVAAVNPQNRADGAEKAGFDSTEFGVSNVVKRE